MKFTLLEIVQDILNDISGDEVDSISDTTEATQIANIVRSTYYHLVSQVNLPEHKTLFKLDETTSTTPTTMTLPDDVLRVDWISYDLKNDPGAFSGGTFSGSGFDTYEVSMYGSIQYMPPNEFFKMIGERKWDGTEILSYTFTGAVDTHEVKYKTNVNPSFYTVLEDYYFIFDALDTDISPDYLESALSLCYGLKKPTFELSDGFTPDLDATEFNWFMEEAKSAASIKLRQVDDPVASKRAKRGWIRSQKSKNVLSNIPTYTSNFPNYGRRR
jgi:hypothetical protein